MNEDKILLTDDLEYVQEDGTVIKYSLYYNLDGNGNMQFTLNGPDGQEISSIETIDPENYPSNIDLTSWPGIFEVVALAQAYINRNITNIGEDAQNKAPEYTRTIWRDNCTALNEVNMNNIENGIYNAYGRLNKLDRFFDSQNGRFLREIDHHGYNILGVNVLELNKAIPYKTSSDGEATSFIEFDGTDVTIRANDGTGKINLIGNISVKGLLKNVKTIKLSNILPYCKNDNSVTIGDDKNQTNLKVTGDILLGEDNKSVSKAINELGNKLENVSNIMDFIGVTTTELEDGKNSNVQINGSEVVPAKGDVVVGPNNVEFVYDGSKWNEIGKLSGNAKSIYWGSSTPENYEKTLPGGEALVGTIYFKII